jgi:hypothetical protein
MTRIFLDEGKDSEKSKRLEEISIGDHLFFPNCRIEMVIDVKPQFGELYTETVLRSSDKDSGEFPGKRQSMVYEVSSGVITSTSKGRVYETKKIGSDVWGILMSCDLKKFPFTVGDYN